MKGNLDSFIFLDNVNYRGEVVKHKAPITLGKTMASYMAVQGGLYETN